ncbi:MAG: HD domain-containing protein [Anaerolineales bacterium]
MDRNSAWALVCQYVKDENLRRHMLAVEAAMRDYAIRFEADPETWGLAGLLHDFDWEIHPDLERHPQDGAPILQEHGAPERVIRCILSHADHTGVERISPMEHALYACDDLTGLLVAVALVRPSKDIRDVSIRSVRKKWKSARFAAGVNRQEVEAGAQALGIELWQHVENVLQSMQQIAPELGLAG